MIISGIILSLLLAASSPDGKDVAHNGLLKVTCIECHTRLPFPGKKAVLRNDVGDVCNRCHPQNHGTGTMLSHPVNPTPSPAMKVPSDMILDSQGKIVCITCHAFHGEYRDDDGKKRFYLRRTPGKTFCYSCHKKLPGIPNTP